MPIVVSHQPSAALTLQLAEAGGAGEYRKWHAQFEQHQEDQKTQAFLGAFGMGSRVGIAGKQMQQQKEMQLARFGHDQKMANIRKGVTAANNQNILQKEAGAKQGNFNILSNLFGLNDPLLSQSDRRQRRERVDYYNNASATDAGASRPNSPFSIKNKLIEESRGRMSAGHVYGLLGTEGAAFNKTAAKIQSMANNDPAMQYYPDQYLQMQQRIASKTIAGQEIYKADQWGQGGLSGSATDPKNSVYTGEQARAFLEPIKAKMRLQREQQRIQIEKRIQNNQLQNTPYFDETGRVPGKRVQTNNITGEQRVIDVPELGDEFDDYWKGTLGPLVKERNERDTADFKGVSEAWVAGQRRGDDGSNQFSVPVGKNADKEMYPSGFKAVPHWDSSFGRLSLSDMPGNYGKPVNEQVWPANFPGWPKEVRAAPKNPEDPNDLGKLKWPPRPNQKGYDPDDWVIPPKATAMPTTQRERYEFLKQHAMQHQHQPDHRSVLIAKRLGMLLDPVTIPTKEDEAGTPYDSEPDMLNQAKPADAVNLMGMSTHQRISAMWDYGKRQGFIPQDTPDHQMPTDIREMEHMVRSELSGRRGAHPGPPPDIKDQWKGLRERNKAAMNQVLDIEKKIKSAPEPQKEGRILDGKAVLLSKRGGEYAAKQRESLKAITVLKRWLPKVIDPSSKIDPKELKGVGIKTEAEVRKRVRDAIQTLVEHGYYGAGDEAATIEQGGVPMPQPQLEGLGDPEQDPWMNPMRQSELGQPGMPR